MERDERNKKPKKSKEILYRRKKNKKEKTAMKKEKQNRFVYTICNIGESAVKIKPV